MKYYWIVLEAPAQLGKNTVFDKSKIPWEITKLHAVFDIWLGGDLLMESPAFYVTHDLSRALKQEKFTGIDSFVEVEVEKSELFVELYPHRLLPSFFMLIIDGDAGVDDFGVSYPNKLIISEKVLGFLQGFDLSCAKIIEYLAES